ncbi:hypothetical protein Q3G72_024786 [Acer saccharum]|nr:hypothetical protein Q3G72_024786 [Acer saccharum]
MSVGKIENAWMEDIKKPSKKTIQDVEAKFKTDDDVIALGMCFSLMLSKNGLCSRVEAMLDKTICATSNVFTGVTGSTFIEDILRLRKDWRLASVCEEYPCQGEEPNFIAGDE